VGGAPASRISPSNATASAALEVAAHAARAALKEKAFGAPLPPARRTLSKSSSTESHSPARWHASNAVLYETASGCTPAAAISSSIATARRGCLPLSRAARAAFQEMRSGRAPERRISSRRKRAAFQSPAAPHALMAALTATCAACRDHTGRSLG